MPEFTGGCYCRQIRYSITLDNPDKEARTSICHCTNWYVPHRTLKWRPAQIILFDLALIPSLSNLQSCSGRIANVWPVSLNTPHDRQRPSLQDDTFSLTAPRCPKPQAPSSFFLLPPLSPPSPNRSQTHTPLSTYRQEIHRLPLRHDDQAPTLLLQNHIRRAFSAHPHGRQRLRHGSHTAVLPGVRQRDSGVWGERRGECICVLWDV